jgi:type II secretory pathway pseudopilin PulG
MVELLTVVLIIGVMGAVAIPNLLAYLRNYEINKSAKEVATEINRARYRAIMKNVNAGVLFVVLDQRRYVWAIQDDQDPQANRSPRPEQMALDALLAEDNQHGVIQTLPEGVLFMPPAADQEPGFRYDRYGSWCTPGDPGCPVLTGFTGTPLVENGANGAVLLLAQASTGLTRTLRVGQGGRVIVEQL